MDRAVATDLAMVEPTHDRINVTALAARRAPGTRRRLLYLLSRMPSKWKRTLLAWIAWFAFEDIFKTWTPRF